MPRASCTGKLREFVPLQECPYACDTQPLRMHCLDPTLLWRPITSPRSKVRGGRQAPTKGGSGCPGLSPFLRRDALGGARRMQHQSLKLLATVTTPVDGLTANRPLESSTISQTTVPS